MKIKYEDVKKKMLADTQTLEAYKALETEYQIALALIEARMQSHMTQEQVARKMHTSQASVARYESGVYLPSLKTIVKYADAVDRSISITISPKHHDSAFR